MLRVAIVATVAATACKTTGENSNSKQSNFDLRFRNRDGDDSSCSYSENIVLHDGSGVYDFGGVGFVFLLLRVKGLKFMVDAYVSRV